MLGASQAVFRMKGTIPGGDQASLRTMLRAARSAVHRTAGTSRQAFLADAVLTQAVLHRLEKIQDASRCVSELTRAGHLDVPWTKLDTISERTRRVVDTGGVTALDRGIVWEILREEIPGVIASLEDLLS